MISPCAPRGKIYTILSEEWTNFLWSFEPVFIPPVFREHLVLVLGWTTGRQGYVSIVMVTPNVPDEANQENYVRIRAPRRSVIANESTVTLRKNKTFSVLVENSYVRLDWVWEVPFAILSAVPKSGMQLMLRAVSMEKIMSFYSERGWDQAWGQTYLSPEYLQGARCCHDQNALGGAASCSHRDGSVSSGIVEQNGDAKHSPLVESDSTGSWDSAHRRDGEEDRRSEEGTPSARQEMVYAGKAHCAALAKLLQEAQ